METILASPGRKLCRDILIKFIPAFEIYYNFAAIELEFEPAEYFVFG
jgi:hypothetical protein